MTGPENLKFNVGGTTTSLAASSIRSGIKKTDYADNKEMQEIFTNVFDKNKDGELDETEAQEMKEKLWNEADANNDGSVSEEEAKGFLAKFGDKLKNVKASDFLKFMQKTEQKAAEKAEESETKWSSYTVQNGESYKNLIKRSLKAQGIDNPTEEQIQKGMEEFEAQNPGAVKTSKKGVKYLLVGAKVQVAGGLEDKNNADEQIDAYKKAVSAKRNASSKSGSSQNNTFKVRATNNKYTQYDEKTKTHYVQNEKGTFVDQNGTKYVKFESYNGNKVVQVDADGSFYTRSQSTVGNRISNHYDASGKQKSSVYVNKKGQRTQVDYYDSKGRITSGKFSQGGKLLNTSYWRDYSKGISKYRNHTTGETYYYKLDKNGEVTDIRCDANGNEI